MHELSTSASGGNAGDPIAGVPLNRPVVSLAAIVWLFSFEERNKAVVQSCNTE
jgi:hypothetical protein